MAITNGGNVGIGTTTPAALLDVVGLGRYLEGSGSYPATGAGMELYGLPNGASAPGSHIQAYDRTGKAWRNLYLDGQNLYLNSNSGGNVGIGTTTPNATLDVAGSIAIEPQGSATAGKGFSSWPLNLTGSAYDSTAGAAANQTFQWQVIPFLNNTEQAQGFLSLSYAVGSNTPTQILHISKAGIMGITGALGVGTMTPSASLEVTGTAKFDGLVTFNSAQTFPGTGTITGITTAVGSGLTGGATSGTPSLAVDSTVARTSVGNSFTGTQSITGDLWGDGNVIADGTCVNSGALSPGLRTCGGGEGISSKRTSGGNQYGLDLYTNNTARMSISKDGNVGIGTTSPTMGMLQVDGTVGAIYGKVGGASSEGVTLNVAGWGFGVWGDTASTQVYGAVVGTADNNTAGFFFNNSKLGETLMVENDASGTATALVAGGSSDACSIDTSGSLYCDANIVGGSKKFRIDHPLDPANKYLYHASVESSEMKNIYDGNVVLDANGEATVQLPDWFEAVNTDFRYQLTPIGRPGPGLYVSQEISGNSFQIAGGSPGLKVSWQVTGVRQDAYARAHPLVVEEAKGESERGKYIHPELYGAPKEQSMRWARHQHGKVKPSGTSVSTQ
jgi:hypothetical protein